MATTSSLPKCRYTRRYGPMGETRTYLWQVWDGRHWPLTAHEEEVFRQDLAQRSRSRLVKVSRSDVTAVLNALRCGLSVDELLTAGPGLVPSRLHAGYELLLGRLAATHQAWRKIVEVPTSSTLASNKYVASLVLPEAVRRLVVEDRSPQVSALAREVGVVREKIEASWREASRKEAELALCAPGLEAVELGRKLYDPLAGRGLGGEPCLWAADYYLPVRVGTLMPERVRRLLTGVYL